MTSLPIVQQLIEFFRWLLVSIHDMIPLTLEDAAWGLSIILLTILVRLVLFPLTWKQFSSSRAMQSLQPKIKELQNKYKNDRAKLQQETMKLYQEYHVNPFASCLPLLLQLPVFISLYYSIRGTDYLNQAVTDAINNASFLWIDRLGDPNHLLLVIYVITQLISTELTLSTMSDPRQKWMMRAMPFIFVVILINFPAGLFLYWITTNLWTIGQQLLIRKLRPVTAAVPEAGKPRKRSRFMESIMAAQDEAARKREATLEAKSAGKSGGGKSSGKSTSGKSRGAAGKPGGKGAQRKGGQPAKGGTQAKGGKKRPPGQGAAKKQGAQGGTPKGAKQGGSSSQSGGAPKGGGPSRGGGGPQDG